MRLIYSSMNQSFGLTRVESNFFRIWLIQQRIPSLLAHLNCRVYTRLPGLNPKHELILPFLHNSIYIELIHNEGYYIVIIFHIFFNEIDLCFLACAYIGCQSIINSILFINCGKTFIDT